MVDSVQEAMVESLACSLPKVHEKWSNGRSSGKATWYANHAHGEIFLRKSFLPIG